MYKNNYFYQSTPQTNLQPNEAQQGSYYNGQLVANQQCQNLQSQNMYEAMKQTIDDSYIKMNQMGYEINNLNNIIYKSNLIIFDLKNKLYKSLKPDILRVHFLTEDKIRRCLFYNTVKVNNEQQSANAIIFSNFIVRKISLYKLDKRYLCAEDLLKIDIIFADGTEKEVIISTKDIDKCKVIHKLSQQGVGIILKEKECVMETVFLQYINSLMNDIEVFVIPYTSGWIKNTDDKYEYQCGYCNPFDISSPYFDNVLKVSDKYDLYSSITLSLKLYSEYFVDENIRIMVLAISIYSLIRTMYNAKYNLQLNKLVLLKSTSMSTKLVKITADLFFDLFNEKRSFLEQSKKEFENMVISSKDSFILLNVSNRKSYYGVDMNIKRIVDIFVNDGSILYKNNHYKAESTLLCLGGELEYTLPNSHYILIDIDDTVVDLDAIEIFSSKKAILNNMVYGFLKYAEDNIPSLSPSSVKIPKGIRNDNGDAYTLLVDSLSFF